MPTMDPMVTDFSVEALDTLPGFAAMWQQRCPGGDMRQSRLIGLLVLGWVMGDWTAETAARWLIHACSTKQMPRVDLLALLRQLHDEMGALHTPVPPRRED